MCNGVLLISLLVIASTGYAYSVNSRRLNDDPKKKDFHPGLIVIATFTWPFFLLAFILLSILRFMLFILRATAYGIFLLLLTFALVGVRKPFIFKILNAIGDALLEAHTRLIKLFLRPWTYEPQPI
jgi:hypothetical protein